MRVEFMFHELYFIVFRATSQVKLRTLEADKTAGRPGTLVLEEIGYEAMTMLLDWFDGGSLLNSAGSNKLPVISEVLLFGEKVWLK
jgi:hypothetical protein